MEVRIDEEMLAALKDAPELPDNLRACVDSAVPDGDDFLVTLDQDEQMALTELCEWYVRTDPETNQLTEQGKLFDRIVQVIIDADLAE